MEKNIKSDAVQYRKEQLSFLYCTASGKKVASFLTQAYNKKNEKTISEKLLFKIFKQGL